MRENPKGRSYIRMLAGGYLVYMAVQMIHDLTDGTPPDKPALVWIFAILFIIAGLAIIAYDARNLWLLHKQEEEEENTDEET